MNRRISFILLAAIVTVVTCCAPGVPSIQLNIPPTIYRGNSVQVSISAEQNTSLLNTTLFLFQATYNIINPNQPLATFPLNGIPTFSSNFTVTAGRYGSDLNEVFELQVLDRPDLTLTETRTLSHYPLVVGETNNGNIGDQDVFDMYEFTLSSTTNIEFKLINISSNLGILLYDTVGASSLLSDVAPNKSTNSFIANDLSSGTYYLKVSGGILDTPADYTLITTLLN